MLGILLAVALAAPGPHSSSAIIRHLVFSAHIDANGNSSTTYRGVNAGESGVPNSVDNSGREQRDTTITVDVTAALNDGSLVAIVSEPKLAPLRVGVTAQGTIIPIDTFREPAIGESALLHLLARDFVVGHDDDPGNAWTLPYGTNHSGELHVTVTKSEGSHVVLALNGAAFETSPQTRRQQLKGSVTYDAAHTVPVNASINESISVETGAGTQTLNYSAGFALKSDTLGGS